jgi:hypothetical protein
VRCTLLNVNLTKLNRRAILLIEFASSYSHAVPRPFVSLVPASARNHAPVVRCLSNPARGPFRASAAHATTA